MATKTTTSTTESRTVNRINAVEFDSSASLPKTNRGNVSPVPAAADQALTDAMEKNPNNDAVKLAGRYSPAQAVSWSQSAKRQGIPVQFVTRNSAIGDDGKKDCDIWAIRVHNGADDSTEAVEAVEA